MIKIDKKIISFKSNVKEQFKDHHAIKRPIELPCQIHQVKVKGEAWTIMVGLYNDRPYEVFGGLSKFIEIPKKYKIGTISKKSGKELSIYSLICGEGDDQFIIKDIVSVFENTTQGSFARIISLSLRHGVPVNFVVEQLGKDQYSDITSFSKVIARVLKNYIPQGTKSTMICNECNSEIVFEGGCKRCLCGSYCG
jgi:ribonucleoside-diphosphate reductase alpha chain